MSDPNTDSSGTSESEINSSKTSQEFHNGTGVNLSQLRLHTLLTKDNISWIILLALAAQVFDIPAHVLAAFAGAC
jgi:hypothetical protein